MSDETPLHKSEVEDCPTEARNRAEGYRPVLRADMLVKEDDPEADAILHLCGKKNVWDVVQMIRFLSEELSRLLDEETERLEDKS